MGFDFGATTLTSSTGLIASLGGAQIMKIGTTGIMQRYFPGQPMFRAGASGGSWTATAAGWNPLILPTTNVNTGSCYNPSNGRFTVPVDGVYLVAHSMYMHGNAAGWYFHPMFWVNGSSTARRPAGGGLHRIRGHGSAAGYEDDTDSMEIIALLAGDYVNAYNYSNAANQYLPQYSRYEGYLLG